MNKSQPHIGISYLKRFPDVEIGSAVNLIKADGLNLMIEEKEPEAYASMEWIVPTAVITYIAKSYFDGFLGEMGKDHYLAVKKGLKLLANKCKGIKMVKLTSTGTTEKVDSTYTQSQTFSIIIQTKNNKRIKLLFDDELSKEDWENAIDKLFDYVIEHYEKQSGDKLSMELDTLESRSFIAYALIDRDTKNLVFYDDNGLFKKQNDIKNKN